MGKTRKYVKGPRYLVTLTDTMRRKEGVVLVIFYVVSLCKNVLVPEITDIIVGRSDPSLPEIAVMYHRSTYFRFDCMYDTMNNLMVLVLSLIHI